MGVQGVGGACDDYRMGLSFAVDPVVTSELREGLLELWVAVTDAGGAVGFPQGTGREVIEPYARGTLDHVRAGDATMVVGRDEGGRLVAVAFLERNEQELFRHWRTVKRVMVHPDAQGLGYGRLLIDEVTRQGQRLGLDHLRLTCRGGTGVDGFYARAGYVEAGRIPRAIRVSADDYRDEISMVLPLAVSVV
jgi:GNAT superfamily N-acetyltransferase